MRLSVYLNVRQPVNCLRRQIPNIFGIYSNLLLCVDDNKVSDYWFDLDCKGQGQKYLTFIYG